MRNPQSGSGRKRPVTPKATTSSASSTNTERLGLWSGGGQASMPPWLREKRRSKSSNGSSGTRLRLQKAHLDDEAAKLRRAIERRFRIPASRPHKPSRNPIPQNLSLAFSQVFRKFRSPALTSHFAGFVVLLAPHSDTFSRPCH